MKNIVRVGCMGVLAAMLAGCANNGQPQAETGVGREAGYAIGSEVGGRHGYLGGTLGGIFGGGAERAAHQQAAKPATTQPAP